LEKAKIEANAKKIEQKYEAKIEDISMQIRTIEEQGRRDVRNEAWKWEERVRKARDGTTEGKTGAVLREAEMLEIMAKTKKVYFVAKIEEVAGGFVGADTIA